MQSSIREEDASEIAATVVGGIGQAALDARTLAFSAVRSLLLAQLNSYKPDTVRAQVVRKSISDLDDLVSAIEETMVLGSKPVHPLVGKSCPSCGRLYAAKGAGVVCQNGHIRP